jgi:Zn-dependent protease with chaperone function
MGWFMYWGAVYKTDVDMERATAIIREEVVRGDVAACQVVRQPDKILILVTQTAGWWQTLWPRLPQRTEWTLWHAQGRLCIGVDRRYWRWYFVLILALVAAVIALWCVALAVVPEDSANEYGLRAFVGFCFLVVSLALLALTWSMVAGPGLERNTALWHIIRERLESEGGGVDAVRGGMSNRMLVKTLFFAVLVGFLLTTFFIRMGYTDLPVEGLAFLVCLVGFAMLLMAAAVSLLLKRGFSDRSQPVICGIAGYVAFLAFAIIPVPWAAATYKADSLASVIANTQKALDIVDGVAETGGSPYRDSLEARIRAAAVLRTLKYGSWMITCGTIVIAVLSCAVFSSGLHYALHSASGSTRMRRGGPSDAIRTAASGKGFIVLYRVVFIGIWILGAALLLASTCWLVPCWVRAAAGTVLVDDRAGMERAVDFSIISASVMTGVRPDDRQIQLVVRAAWIVHGLALLFLAGLSLGEMIWRRRHAHKILMKGPMLAAPEYAKAEAVLKRLPAGGKRPLVALAESDSMDARSYIHGLFWRTQIVVVSTRCLAELDDEELKALLAHELGHFKAKHHSVYTLLQVLARLTFVGDSFANALTNSWGCETTADLIAVSDLGASESALRGCLLKMENINGAEVVPSGGAEGLGVVGFTAEEFRELVTVLSSSRPMSLKQRLKTSWQLFFRQYTGGTGVGYWHPPAGHRIAAMEHSIAARARTV